ncbi:MAG: extracellular solute-binding protein [Patescibacteria group bacterium]
MVLNKKYLLASAMMVCLFVFAGFGCKGQTAEEKQATKAVSLEYWTVYDDVDQINAQIAKYTASRPYLTVTVRQLRSDELYDRLVEALAEDKGPDIISINVRDLARFKSKLSAMPPSYSDTTVTTQKNIINQVETTVATKSLALPTAFQIGNEYLQTVKKDVIIDNKIYGLPLSLDTMAIYYNKDLLDRAQVAEPPETWTEFQDAVKKISKYNAESGKITQSGAALGSANNIEGVDDILNILFKQNSVSLISSDNRAAFNTVARDSSGANISPAISVMDFYTDFANATRDTYSWNESMDNSVDAFVQGKLGFLFGYSYNNAQIKSRAPQLNYGILPMIQLDPDNPVNAANYWVQCVVSKSAGQNTAWGLINFLSRTSANKEYLTATARPTALRANVASQKEDVNLQPFVSQLLVAENWYRGNDYAGASQALKDMISEWLQVPPKYESKVMQWDQEVLNRAAAKINQTL